MNAMNTASVPSLLPSVPLTSGDSNKGKKRSANDDSKNGKENEDEEPEPFVNLFNDLIYDIAHTVLLYREYNVTDDDLLEKVSQSKDLMAILPLMRIKVNRAKANSVEATVELKKQAENLAVFVEDSATSKEAAATSVLCRAMSRFDAGLAALLDAVRARQVHPTALPYLSHGIGENSGSSLAQGIAFAGAAYAIHVLPEVVDKWFGEGCRRAGASPTEAQEKLPAKGQQEKFSIPGLSEAVSRVKIALEMLYAVIENRVSEFRSLAGGEHRRGPGPV